MEDMALTERELRAGRMSSPLSAALVLSVMDVTERGYRYFRDHVTEGDMRRAVGKGMRKR